MLVLRTKAGIKQTSEVFKHITTALWANRVVSAFSHHTGKSLISEHLSILYLILQYSKLYDYKIKFIIMKKL